MYMPANWAVVNYFKYYIKYDLKGEVNLNINCTKSEDQGDYHEVVKVHGNLHHVDVIEKDHRQVTISTLEQEVTTQHFSLQG